MNEAYLKKRLKEAILEAMPGAVVIRHEDKFSAGVPDMSVTWRGTTSWIEVKYSRKGRTAKPTALQDAMLRKLAKAGALSLLLNYRDEVRVTVAGAPQPSYDPFNVADLDRIHQDGVTVTTAPHFAKNGRHNHESIAQAIRFLHEVKERI